MNRSGDASNVAVRGGHADAFADAMTPAWRRTLVLTPIATMLSFTALLLVPFSHATTRALLGENDPVEFLTFVFALWAAGIASRLASSMARGEETFAATFYLAFAALMLFIGMEEIGWGQQYFHFETPAFWRPYNAQGETTLHNVKLIAKYLESLPLAYGIVAMCGVFLAPRLRFPESTWPSRLLMSWFAVIALQSAIDLELYRIHAIDELIDDLGEVSEMLVTLSAVLYVRLSERRLAWRSVAIGTAQRSAA